MSKKRISETSFKSTASIKSFKSVSRTFDTSKILSDDKSILSTTLNSSKQTKSKKLNDSQQTITSIIEEKVTNLKHKFGELTGLRKKLADSGAGQENLDKFQGETKNRIRSFDSSKTDRPKEFITDSMFKSEEKRLKKIEKTGNNLIFDNKTFYCNPNFDKLMFDDEYSKVKIEKVNTGSRSAKIEIECLKQKLLSTQKELHDSELIRLQQESVISKQLKDLSYYEERTRSITETNKSLKLHINRLENKLKNIDGRKAKSTNAIKNLSYIILSKDSSKESPTKYGNDNNSITLKYLEYLNELHASDQFTINILNKLASNYSKDSYNMIIDIQDIVHERLEKTRKKVDELERIVYDCKSPILQRTETVCEKDQTKDINLNDFACFLKCEAFMVEELLMLP
jgi:hypothetical protein